MNPEPSQLVAHLFRHEAGRMASVLTCWLGFGQLDQAEDIVQDTLMQALHSWPIYGIPDNPRAWLYQVAKNRTLDVLRRDKTAQRLASEAAATEPTAEAMDTDRLFFDDDITDSQLRMLFACCHPALPVESQIAMCLKILGGLSIQEIAGAFLTAPATVEKRLYRAKERVRQGEIPLAVPAGPQLPPRLDAVLRSLYLLFNEGYTSSHPDTFIRQELCAEAMRLVHLLTQYPRTAGTTAYALLALLCFQAARFPARTDDAGDMLLLPNQNRSLYNPDLMQRGQYYLNQAAVGNLLTDYHLEAAIAACHTLAPSYESTDWPKILYYYDLLLIRKPSPVVALNRAVALAEVAGTEAALANLISLSGLENNQYFHALLADLYLKNNQPEAAHQHYSRAWQLTPSLTEKALLSWKLFTGRSPVDGLPRAIDCR